MSKEKNCRPAPEDGAVRCIMWGMSMRFHGTRSHRARGVPNSWRKEGRIGGAPVRSTANCRCIPGSYILCLATCTISDKGLVVDQ